jgi:uncharacterized protein
MRRPLGLRTWCGVVTALGIFLLCGTVFATQSNRIPPPPDRWATDEAGFITAGTRAEIDSQLEAFERETGHQVLLYVSRTTGDVPLEDFAARAFAAWKVGRKGLDDGLVLFIFADNHRIRIETGYGLEGVIPDAVAGRVINNILVPGIQRGDADGAVREAVSSLLETISGKPAPGTGEPVRSRTSSESEVPPIFMIIAGIIFLIILITHPRLALWLLYTLLAGGRGGGGGFGGGGGGGFSGGGGRSGGGGASGGW